jgi:hypothetical protein
MEKSRRATVALPSAVMKRQVTLRNSMAGVAWAALPAG